MQQLRISKYDPARRDKEGRFTHPDWTSVSDIGRVVGGIELSVAEYLRVEQLHVDAVDQLLSTAGVRSLVVSDLERNDPVCPSLPADPDLRRDLDRIDDGVLVSGALLLSAVRLNLREIIWCRLSGEGGAYVHFGYDYYAYVGVAGDRVDLTGAKGLFIETDSPSPYS